ncbi:proline racemase [Desulfosarcina alkanivorans]|uniref:Proline racemase n=1 Tax=Desulfosarcina alkanivorans TaxID=571177 RepID=A0A5K7YR53_9BACT|nr:proline racemase family protein [Desulfosarcina alkanivorans]BBO70763.1 proline racemase [Desulfosarcina alkanivorans]
MLEKMQQWRAPDDWQRITTIDAHTGGEPFRIITGGLPALEGDTILQRRRFMTEHLDHLRTALMWEPRGHADMYGCIITPPVSPEADIGVLFLHNEGYSSMCGHGIIGVATVAIETGMIAAVEPVTTMRIDAPAGLVTAHARVEKGRVKSVYFHNVPAFVITTDRTVDVPGLGPVSYDIAYGGAFYAFVKADDLKVTTTPKDFNALIDRGMAVKRAVMAAGPIRHPFEADLSFLYGTIVIGPPHSHGAHSSNVCIFAEGEVDRCPTGTGVSARLALHHARGEIGIDDPIVIESILGTRFAGRVVSTTTFGPHEAVIPEVEGSAWIVGRSEFLMDPADPLKDGFIFR